VELGFCLAGIAGIWALAYLRMPLWVWLAASALLLLAISFSSGYSSITITLLWLLFSIVAIPLSWPSLRRKLITDKIFPLFCAAVPSMSQTEREALEAGSVWWDGELFSGRPDWKKLLAIPAPQLSEEEQAFLDGPVDQLCQMLDDWKITEELHDLPPEVWQYIKDNKFFGMIIPKEQGGLGFSAQAHSQVVVKIAGRSITAAVTIMVPNSLGPAELLMRYGTDEQRKYYLPRLAKGQDIPCFALTGPDAGSDASSIPDRGIVCKQLFKGKETLGMRVTWDKRYITLGPVATVLGLAFRLYDPEKLLGDQEDIGITLALIPTDTEGVNIGRRHYPLNMVFQNGPNSGQDVFIPMEWVIGGETRVGQGWRMLMECLAAGRAISLPSLSTGAGKLVCRATGAYARIRKQFNMPIGRFEGVEEVLARMAGYTYMMEGARAMTAQSIDLGEEPSVASAIVKYNLTERMRKIVNDAMDVQGGAGISLGPRNVLARVYQAIPISITVEGANILTRTLIVFGQGAIRCHPYVLKELAAAKNPDKEEGKRDFDRAFIAHIGFTISNLARTFFLALSGARLVPVPEVTTAKYYYQQVTRMSAAFALVADVSMLVLGGSLKRREKLSGRLADVLSQLYLISATLKRFADEGNHQDDYALVQWSCDDALLKLQTALDEFLRNFPVRSVSWVLRVLIFPWGKPYNGPSDLLGRRVAESILTPSGVRDRLTKGVFITRDIEDARGRLEVTLEQVVAAEPIEQKIRQAVKSGKLDMATIETLLDQALDAKIINSEEADTVRVANASRAAVIAVDDFTSGSWRK